MLRQSHITVAAMLALCGAAAADTRSDNFNRSDGPIGGEWTINTAGSVWEVIGGRGRHTSSGVNDIIQHNVAIGGYADSVVYLDVFAPGITEQYSGVVIGLGGTEGILVKIQDQDPVTAGFSHIGIYKTSTFTAWPGTGMGFGALSAPFVQARLKVYFATPDIIVVELDTDFDGDADQVYTKDGVLGLASNMGNRFGIAAWRSAAEFDNYRVDVTRSRFENFNRPNGPVGPAWTPDPPSVGWVIDGNRGAETGSTNFESLRNNTARGSYSDGVYTLDPFALGTQLQYSGLLIGLGGSDTILVKLQDQSSGAGFSHIGIYHGSGSTYVAWPGTGTGFDPLTTPGFTSARMRVYFPDPDRIVVDLDTDLNGLYDQSYTRDNVSSIARNLGSGSGIATYGDTAVFDNFGANYGVWVERGDAGDLIPGAQNVVQATGSNALTAIHGALGPGDQVDMYRIRICDVSRFYATTVGPSGLGAGSANFDTQLFLFTPGGIGVVANDDTPGVDLRSTIDNRTGCIGGNGTYFLAISQFNHDPVSSGGLIFPIGGIVCNTGAGGAFPLTGWTGASAGSEYEIALAGTCFPGCYANCDGSTVNPVLNVQDFTCFLQRYAAGDPYANCDNSAVAPLLNVQDFTCFLQRYAAGCP